MTPTKTVPLPLPPRSYIFKVPSLKIFNSYSITMSWKQWQHKNIMSVIFTASVTGFWVYSIGCSGKLYVAFKHFKEFSLFWAFWKRNYQSISLWALFRLKSSKAFRTAQWKQPWLLKARLKIDLNFRFKSCRTVLLETVVSCQLLLQVLQRKTLIPLPLDTSTTALMCIFLSILNWSSVNQKNSVIKVWRYRSREFLKAISLSPKSKQALHGISLNHQQ